MTTKYSAIIASVFVKVESGVLPYAYSNSLAGYPAMEAKTLSKTFHGDKISDGASLAIVMVWLLKVRLSNDMLKTTTNHRGCLLTGKESGLLME